MLVGVRLRIVRTLVLGALDLEREPGGDHRVRERRERELVDPDEAQPRAGRDVDALPEPAGADEDAALPS